MEYPEILLPNPLRKYIKCDLSIYYLSRSTDVKDIIDDHKEVATKYICSPSEHILDLSINLLGHFEYDHHYISLIDKKNNEYIKYCDPDDTVAPPVIIKHYILEEVKGWWSIKISEIMSQEYKINYKNEEILEISPVIEHTPMRWNFWHFSILWDYVNFELESRTRNQQNKIKNIISSNARAVLKQFAKVGEIEHSLLPRREFCS